MSRFTSIVIVMSYAFADETRGTIQGGILDPSCASVPGASVLVENLDMNTSARLIANDAGYYESGFAFAVFQNMWRAPEGQNRIALKQMFCYHQPGTST